MKSTTFAGDVDGATGDNRPAADILDAPAKLAAYQIPSWERMNKIQIQSECQDRSQPIFTHLEALVSELLANGNELARAERWGSNKEGFACYLSEPINFSLIRERFELPESIVLSEENDLIACSLTWATIYGSKKKRGV